MFGSISVDFGVVVSEKTSLPLSDGFSRQEAKIYVSVEAE
ncbi:MAG: hypothetical protein ACD_37C00029G0001 [uncultured bacterium]|nr:MAG: hypothetical protein ACD_37C00029G0001 [uncultured bacterium]